AANENRTPDEGLSYAVVDGQRFTLQQAVAECGGTLIGERIWKKYKKWPVYSKFFDNMGPIPHHMHQDEKQAKLVGQEGKPESYYFRCCCAAAENNSSRACPPGRPASPVFRLGACGGGSAPCCRRTSNRPASVCICSRPLCRPASRRRRRPPRAG